MVYARSLIASHYQASGVDLVPDALTLPLRPALAGRIIELEQQSQLICYHLVLTDPASSKTPEESNYLQVTLKLSWDEVTVPLGLTVMWKLSCTRKLFPGPLPMIRKLFTAVYTIVPPAVPLKSDRVTPVP